MALANLDQLVAAASQKINYLKTGAVTTVAAQWFSTLDVAGNPGAGSLAVGNTANGVVPTDATAGFPLINAFGGGNAGYIKSIQFGNTVACRMALYDRVFHVGSIVATSLATTTLSAQPSYVGRLPNSDYKGLEIFLEINTAISNTATTVSVTYTNQDGVTGRSTGAISIQNLTTRRLVKMPLQAGDTGVQKIESVTVGGTVASAGTFNVIVARLLIDNMRCRLANDGDVLGFDRTGLPIVYDTSALWLILAADSTSGGVPELNIDVINA